MNRIEKHIKKYEKPKNNWELYTIILPIAKEAFEAGQNSIIESPGYWEVKGMAYPLKPNFQEWLKAGEK